MNPFYTILEWENTFGFVYSCKSTLPKQYEIYKGNSENYKGKMKNQAISVFCPKHYFVEYIRCHYAIMIKKVCNV